MSKRLGLLDYHQHTAAHAQLARRLRAWRDRWG